MNTQIFSKFMTVFAAALLLFGLVSIAAAQPGPPPQAPRWGKEQVETVVIGKFASELNLTPEQAEKFFPRFRQFQNQSDDIYRQQRVRRMELDSLSGAPNAEPQQVNRLLTEQTRQEQQVSDLKRQFLADISGFLTPQQVSRCSILMEELPRRIHKFIEEHHRNERPGPEGRDDRPRGHGGHRRGY